MKNIISNRIFAIFGLFLLIGASDAFSQTAYKPFVLASETTETKFSNVVNQALLKLEDAGFEFLGEYSPYLDTFVKNATVIVVTKPELRAMAKGSLNAGFAAPWRISVTETAKGIQVSYINPHYLKYAYRLEGDIAPINTALQNALGRVKEFGSEKGLKAKELAKYRYMIGMEKFQHVYDLAEHESHAKALETLERNLASNTHGLGKVYRLDIDDNTTIFGVSRKAPSEDYKYVDDEFIMQNVDFKELKGTAYLPYEIMVKGNQVLALHMRYRMALHYPDLKMMGDNSFMKIRRSPNKIAWVLGEISK